MNVIDLFCGCGGFSKGFEQAGFDIRLGIDIWQDAVTTYKANFPHAATIVGDISTLNCDIVSLSPPLQLNAWSFVAHNRPLDSSYKSSDSCIPDSASAFGMFLWSIS